MKYKSVKDIAEKFGVHVNTVYRWIEHGHIKAEKISKKWFIVEPFEKSPEEKSQNQK